MSVNFRSVFVSDPVDASCAALLTEHGIPVTTKYKLSKDELINELQVGRTIVIAAIVDEVEQSSFCEKLD
jgi:D-3-phosphoglycerate dehydrogenase